MLKTIPYVEKVRMTGADSGKTNEKVHVSFKKTFGNHRKIETESDITYFGEKGRFSRFGVYIVHLSILIILIGGIAGSIYGFKGFVNILEGETVNHFFLRGKQADVSKPLPFSVRCDDFKITFYDLKNKEKYIKDYTSYLTILEGGKEVLKRTVQVNHPLHHRGIAFYQSSYGTLNAVTLGVQWKNRKEKTLLEAAEGDTVPIPGTNALLRVLKYAPQIHNFGEGIQLALFRPNQEPRVFWAMKGMPPANPQPGEEFVISLDQVTSREYTGLQVAKDPGVWIVWVGCALMILGLIVSFFFSHQRVWVRIPKGSSGGEIVLAGSTNKNRVGFEKTFNQLLDGIRSF